MQSTFFLIQLAHARAQALKKPITIRNASDSVSCDPGLLTGLSRKLAPGNDDTWTIAEGDLLNTIENIAIAASKDPTQKGLLVGFQDQFLLTDERRKAFIELGEKKLLDQSAPSMEI